MSPSSMQTNGNHTDDDDVKETAQDQEFYLDTLHDNLLNAIDKLLIKSEINFKMKHCNENKTKQIQFQNRIVDLENALRESVLIAGERDNEFYLLEKEKAELSEKVKKTSQRILSLQNASLLRCSTCRSLRSTTSALQEKVRTFLDDKKVKLTYLTCRLQEALELLITEMDTQIANLEVSGARSQQQKRRIDQLRSNRNKLNQRLKIESENSIALLSDCVKLENELCQSIAIKEPILDDHD